MINPDGASQLQYRSRLVSTNSSVLRTLIFGIAKLLKMVCLINQAKEPSLFVNRRAQHCICVQVVLARKLLQQGNKNMWLASLMFSIDTRPSGKRSTLKLTTILRFLKCKPVLCKFTIILNFCLLYVCLILFLSFSTWLLHQPFKALVRLVVAFYLSLRSGTSCNQSLCVSNLSGVTGFRHLHCCLETGISHPL